MAVPDTDIIPVPFHFLRPLHLPPFTLTHSTGPRVPSVLPGASSPQLMLPPPAPWPTAPMLPRPPSFPLRPPHPLLLSDAFTQEDAGGAHGELHGGAGHQSQDGFPPPGPPLCLSLLLFSVTSLPLLALGALGQRAVAAGAEISSGWEGSERPCLPIWPEAEGQLVSGSDLLSPEWN